MNDATLFWSYVHADDEAESGRVVQLARDLKGALGLLGVSSRLFVDCDALAWGDAWAAGIDRELDLAAFFIPVVTPRYWQSTSCRSEVLRYVGSPRSADGRLVLPIRYAPSEEFAGDVGTADLVAEILASYQWVDFTATRLRSRASRGYRSAVNAMAARITGVVEAMASKDISPAVPVAEHLPPGMSLDLTGDDIHAAIDLLVQAVTRFGDPARLLEELDAASRVRSDRPRGSETSNPMDYLSQRVLRQLLSLRHTVKSALAMLLQPDRPLTLNEKDSLAIFATATLTMTAVIVDLLAVFESPTDIAGPLSDRAVRRDLADSRVIVNEWSYGAREARIQMVEEAVSDTNVDETFNLDDPRQVVSRLLAGC